MYFRVLQFADLTDQTTTYTAVVVLQFRMTYRRNFQHHTADGRQNTVIQIIITRA